MDSPKTIQKNKQTNKFMTFWELPGSERRKEPRRTNGGRAKGMPMVPGAKQRRQRTHFRWENTGACSGTRFACCMQQDKTCTLHASHRVPWFYSRKNTNLIAMGLIRDLATNSSGFGHKIPPFPASTSWASSRGCSRATNTRTWPDGRRCRAALGSRNSAFG